jgi:L-fucose isomerase-like protein
MTDKLKTGYVCFGEVNTPIEQLKIMDLNAKKTLSKLGIEIIDCGIVIDDPDYITANAAVEKLKGKSVSSLIICVAGWVPTHAVIKVTDAYRHLPMLLWGLCGWKENGKIITTAGQAGTTALRPAFEALDYRFKYIYSVIGRPEPLNNIHSFLKAAHTANKLRNARVGTMGYRDMLLYGTQYEGNSMRRQIGVEVEPFEMLEMIQNIDTLDDKSIAEGVAYIKKNWVFQKPCNDSVIEQGVKYALAIGKKIKERGYEAITLIDVDGMKKLLSFPPAMVFMLLSEFYGVQTVPENDVLGSVVQLIVKYITGETAPYLEYYEFFGKSMLAGVPDFIPPSVTDGEITILPAAFGLLSSSLLNVSKVRTGYITCTRLFYINGLYKMHIFTGEGKEPPAWEEFGWDAPAPQLPSLEIFPDSCTVDEFAQKVSSQHVIIGYGDHTEALHDLCRLLDIEVI